MIAAYALAFLVAALWMIGLALMVFAVMGAIFGRK